MKKLKQCRLSLLMILLLFACSEGNDESGEKILPSGFTAKVDGEAFEATSQFVTATVTIDSDNTYNFGIAAFDDVNPATGQGRVMVVSCIGSDFNQLSSGTTFNNFDFNTQEGMIAYYFDTRTEDGLLLYSGYLSSLGLLSDEFRTNSSLRITSIDRDNQTISGEFSFESYDDNGVQLYKITEGKFGGVSYTVED
ncbi:MAG: hypothetical protein AAF223_20745 [Bacteroidota bacterium]